MKHGRAAGGAASLDLRAGGWATSGKVGDPLRRTKAEARSRASRVPAPELQSSPSSGHRAGHSPAAPSETWIEDFLEVLFVEIPLTDKPKIASTLSKVVQ